MEERKFRLRAISARREPEVKMPFGPYEGWLTTQVPTEYLRFLLKCEWWFQGDLRAVIEAEYKRRSK